MTFLMIVVRLVVVLSPDFISVPELPSFFLVDEAILILRVTMVVIFFVPEAVPVDLASPYFILSASLG